VREAREAGCEVIGVLALVDREEEDGASHIRKEVDIYIPLYRRSDFPRLDAPSHALMEP
jgi:orotate phosphoribosyltransferase